MFYHELSELFQHALQSLKIGIKQFRPFFPLHDSYQDPKYSLFELFLDDGVAFELFIILYWKELQQYSNDEVHPLSVALSA